MRRKRGVPPLRSLRPYGTKRFFNALQGLKSLPTLRLPLRGKATLRLPLIHLRQSYKAPRLNSAAPSRASLAGRKNVRKVQP